MKGITQGVYDVTVSRGSCKHDYTLDFAEDWGGRFPEFSLTSD